MSVIILITFFSGILLVLDTITLQNHRIVVAGKHLWILSNAVLLEAGSTEADCPGLHEGTTLAYSDCYCRRAIL